ncbi:hypothetical protein jhhlp_001248 [Lomentospora prolificans]|uniref:Pre-mRNA-splicing factor SYF2 n=1 Tax=Lomentospora prolificans TaxID=41688 RepID=A0A2N3NHX6_9PEZI|nr:hypothetical protein jhhlp_001248 [Lomentospora prolificans]
MPPAKKRKTQAGEEPDPEAASSNPEQASADEPSEEPTPQEPSEPTEPKPSSSSTPSSSTPAGPSAPALSAKDRLARFKALKARAKTSSEENFKAATREAQRVTEDPSQLASLQRKHAIASHKLVKADIEEAGGDFERKRAWDWTVDESESWDRRMKKKAARRDGNLFADYTSEANKVYKRQLRNIAPDMERYEKDKMKAIERAAASGGLDLIETEDGELIAVDKDGSFYSTEDSTTFTENKPDKAAIDRLVDDLRRAEEQRLKKRKERMAKDGDDGDVTYINEKNKQFNQKLARFYNKYTADLRDSFERGTMI